MVKVFLFLSIYTFQEDINSLIIGDWNGIETLEIHHIYLNDSLVYKKEELTNNIRRMTFTQDSISMGIVKEKPIDTYDYTINKEYLTIDGSEFKILQLDDSVLKIKVIYSDYKYHLETYKRANESATSGIN